MQRDIDNWQAPNRIIKEFPETKGVPRHPESDPPGAKGKIIPKPDSGIDPFEKVDEKAKKERIEKMSEYLK